MHLDPCGYVATNYVSQLAQAKQRFDFVYYLKGKYPRKMIAKDPSGRNTYYPTP